MESHGHRFIVDDYPARKFGDFPVRYVVTFARPGKPLDFKEAYFQTNPMWLERVFHDSGPKCLLAFSGGNVPGVIDAHFQVMSVAVARILFFDTGFL